MQHKHFKRLLPLTAVALLTLVFLARGQDATPGPCETPDIQPDIQTEERWEPLDTQPELLEQYGEAWRRADEIRHKYDDLFRGQPNFWGVSTGYFQDKNDNALEVPDGAGGWKRVVGIHVEVTEKVDQCILRPEDRIPDTIEGVPVRIVEVTPLELVSALKSTMPSASNFSIKTTNPETA